MKGLELRSQETIARTVGLGYIRERGVVEPYERGDQPNRHGGSRGRHTARRGQLGNEGMSAEGLQPNDKGTGIAQQLEEARIRPLLPLKQLLEAEGEPVDQSYQVRRIRNLIASIAVHSRESGKPRLSPDDSRSRDCDEYGERDLSGGVNVGLWAAFRALSASRKANRSP